MTRTERRRLATHEDLIEATKQLLLERGPRDVNARLIDKRADHAAATFYNHFADVEAAVSETIAPATCWFNEWAERIEHSDDFVGVISAFIADYLAKLETDGDLWAVVHATRRPLFPSEEFDAFAHRIALRHDEHMVDRGVAPGAAGSLVLDIMAACGDLYGGRVLDRDTRKRIARMLHAAHWQHPEEVAARTEISLDLAERARSGGWA